VTRPWSWQAVVRGVRRAPPWGALATGVLLSLGCASAGARGRTPPPPFALVLSGPLDLARASVRAALEEEALRIDGQPSPDSDALSSTFVVRRGGMGESEIVLRLRLSPATRPGHDPPSVRLHLEATAREVRRMRFMSPEDARSPRTSGEAHPVQDNDRETLQRIGRLVTRLERGGWTRIPDGDPRADFARRTLAPPTAIALRWRTPPHPAT